MQDTVSILDFGAKADGSLQTSAIQAAIDHIGRGGAGRVIIPKGTFLTGGLFLRSGVTLHLEEGAVLQGSGRCEDYGTGCNYGDSYNPLAPRPAVMRRSRWHHALITALDAGHIGISGEGAVLDGVDCRDPYGEEGFRGPHLIYFSGCRHIELQGYTIRRSANYAHLMEDCSEIAIKDVTVLGGHDGIHLQRCRDAVIEGCRLHTGDDCIAGSDNLNVRVLRCDLNTSCNGFRFGALGLCVKDCRLHGPGIYEHRISNRHNMLSAFQYFSPVDRNTQSIAGGWVIADCAVENVDYLFVYNFSGEDRWQSAQPLYDVCMKNIRAADIRNPLMIYGGNEKHFTLSMERVEFSFARGHESQPVICIRNFGALKLKSFSALNHQSVPFIEASGGGKLTLQDVVGHTQGDFVHICEDKTQWHIPRF